MEVKRILMGTILFIIAFSIKLALLAYSLVTKSYQKKTRSVVYLLDFAILSALFLTSVIQWSFRWYGLTALLFIQAARGVWMLLNSKAQEREYKVRAVVFRTIAMILLTFVSITPALMFPSYNSMTATGPYTAATLRYTYTDESRIEAFANSGENRKVNVAFWYPQNVDGDETYPLIVFSHGGLGLETSNETLFRELASHGYVICSIGHPYHAFWTRGEDGRITFVSLNYFQEIQHEDAKHDKKRSFYYYGK
jgi:hypothetical protein